MTDGVHLRPAPAELVVTGAGGWLGTALMATLARDGMPGSPGAPALRALVGEPGEVSGVLAVAPGAEVFIGDVREPATIDELLSGTKDADVIHAAGIIHPRRSADFESVNVGGTRQVVEGASRHGARRLVHVSSNSAFGCNPSPGERFRSNEPFNPYMGYGRSKMLAEVVVGTEGRESLERVVVRPPWFNGPYQPERQTRFFSSVRQGRFPVFGDGRNRRSMAQVEALADGTLRACLAENAAGRSYWLADAEPYEMARIIETVREALELEGYPVSGSIRHLPGIIADAARVADAAIQSRGAYVQEVHVLSEMNQTIACEVSDAVADLGYSPPTALLPGMRRAVAWCREAGIEL